MRCSAGESYGIVNTFILHFGLGTYTTIPTLTITWPSGLVETFTDVAVDQNDHGDRRHLHQPGGHHHRTTGPGHLWQW